MFEVEWWGDIRLGPRKTRFCLQTLVPSPNLTTRTAEVLNSDQQGNPISPQNQTFLLSGKGGLKEQRWHGLEKIKYVQG
jgi:hypothetical protein